MKVERRSGHEVRHILIGLITDQVVLSRVAGKWEESGLFNSRWANLIGEWCIKHHNKYGRPPNQDILGYFEDWAVRNKDVEIVNAVEKFLSELSAEHELEEKEGPDRNSQYVLDLCERHFNLIRLRRLLDKLQDHVDGGELNEAQDLLNGHHKLEVSAASGFDPFFDQDAVREAMTESRKPVIHFSGALGEFFKDELERDSFHVFMGPEKRGKSFWLLEMVVRALMERRKVAFFVCGDMSKNQVLRRLSARVAGKPLRARTVKFPIGWSEEKSEIEGVGEVPLPLLEDREFRDGLSWQEAWRALQRMREQKIKSKDSLLKISVHPAGSLKVRGIDTQLRQWEREGWGAPDVIVIDFMDVLDMSGRDDFRHRINQTWLEARSLAQTWHALVVSATQADASAYLRPTMDMSNFSEDKRKFGHVNGMLGINQTPDEKERGVQRLNWIVLREDEFSTARCVHVAGCPALARPVIRSSF